MSAPVIVVTDPSGLPVAIVDGGENVSSTLHQVSQAIPWDCECRIMHPRSLEDFEAWADRVYGNHQKGRGG